VTTYERRQSLLEMLRKQPGLRVPEVAQALGVSEGTVRNDLNALEEEGRLKRVHGGAVLSGQNQFQNNSFVRRFKQNVAAKLAIASERPADASALASIPAMRRWQIEVAGERLVAAIQPTL